MSPWMDNVLSDLPERYLPVCGVCYRKAYPLAERIPYTLTTDEIPCEDCGVITGSGLFRWYHTKPGTS